MASKMLKKKRSWRAFCRAQVFEGLVNNEAGGWIRANETGGTYKNMHRDMRAGYQVERRSK